VVDRNLKAELVYNKYIESIIAPAKRAFPAFRSRAIEFSTIPQLYPPACQSDQRAEAKINRDNLTDTHLANKSEATLVDGMITSDKLALYVRRKPPRTFSPEIEEQFVQSFEKRGITLKPIDFSNMSWMDQVTATCNASLLVGIHGNGLTNCLWMAPGSTVIEIFPPNSHHYDYQMLAEVAGLNYFGIEACAQNPFVFTVGSRFGAAYGSTEHPITELPWPWLDEVLDILDD